MDWSYIAGYFDGEGHVRCSQQGTRRQQTYGLAWYNTHRGSLEAIMRFMGCGYLEEGKLRANQTKLPYTLRIARKTDLLRVIDEMLPHLIIKKSEVERLRQYLIEFVDETRAANTGKLAAVDTETLRRWYHDEGLSLTAIAKRTGVKQASAVSQLMERRGIERREAGGAHMKGVPKSEETRRRMLEAQRRRRAND